MIQFTRAVAASETSLSISAVREDAEPLTPDARLFQYEHEGYGQSRERWFYDDFPMSIQSIIFTNGIGSVERPSYYAFLSAEGEVHHSARPTQYLEVIPGTGSDGANNRFYGYIYSLRQIGARLYACGAGGQIYVREARNNWSMMTDKLLFDPRAEREAIRSAPDTNDPGYVAWLLRSLENPASRNIFFNDMQGLSESAIYLCGEVGPGTKPVLCFWDGKTLEELKVPLAEAALTGIYIENEESVWVCGREGVILHGSRNRGFTPVAAKTGLNLFHMITPYRGKLVLPASVRPGGLYEYDPKSGAFGRFDPPLPRLRSRNDPDSIDGGPFFAQAVGDVLWVVASKDIFRFDGHQWERIEHPDI